MPTMSKNEYIIILDKPVIYDHWPSKVFGTFPCFDSAKTWGFNNLPDDATGTIEIVRNVVPR